MLDHYGGTMVQYTLVENMPQISRSEESEELSRHLPAKVLRVAKVAESEEKKYFDLTGLSTLQRLQITP